MSATNNNRLWILGADDPEMSTIEKLLIAAGERVAYAEIAGDRVTSSTAYQGTSHQYIMDYEQAGDIPEMWYLVECQVPKPTGRLVVRIDHHRSGDPGFGLPTAQFLKASSIGQVLTALGQSSEYPSSWPRVAVPRHPHWCGHLNILDGVWVARTTSSDGDPGDDDAHATAVVVPLDYVFTAAADQCLAAAYRGECPGVDPVELARHRTGERAKFQHRTVSDVRSDIDATTVALVSAPLMPLAILRDEGWLVDAADASAADDMLELSVRDMRRSSPYPELPEAACRLGVGYVAGPFTCPDGRKKVVCSGTHRQILAFMSSWAAAQGLVDVYGDPARGLAGGYLP
jgi:hypothetical protein